jgi:hypothetical protein
MSRIPLVVGITGHRDPAAVSVAAVEEAVRAILRSIRRSAPKHRCSSSPHSRKALTVSPMGVALDESCAVIAALPMRDRYIQDFATPESRAEFEELL